MKCISCGAEMEQKINGHCISWHCSNCGDGLASSYYDEIELDRTDYSIVINPIPTPSVEQLKTISKYLNMNYIEIRKLLTLGEAKITRKATEVKTIVSELTKVDIDFDITPSFPY
jgi:hypothetical protein